MDENNVTVSPAKEKIDLTNNMLYVSVLASHYIGIKEVLELEK